MFWKYDIRNIWTWIKLFLYIMIGIFIGMLLWLKIIIIEINESDDFLEGILFSLLNALIFGMYLNVCGFGYKISKEFLKWFVLAFLLYFIITGFGYFGIAITINLDRTNIDELKHLLYYDKIITNSKETILFVLFNLHLLIIIFFVSHITEAL